MPRFHIHHLTKYVYDAPVRDSTNQVILFPVKDEFQDVLRHELNISAKPEVNIYPDFYGNRVGCFMHTDPHTELLIDSKLEVVTKPKALPAEQHTASEQWAELEKIKTTVSFIDFLREPPFKGEEELSVILSSFREKNLAPMEVARGLNEYVYDAFRYIQGVTSVETTLEEILELKAGVCQDFAHVLLSLLRRMRVPA